MRENLSIFPIPFHTSEAPSHPSLPFLFCHLCASWHRALRHTLPCHLPTLSAHVDGNLPVLGLFMANPTAAEWAQLWCSMSRLTDRARVTSVRPFLEENIASFSLSGSTCNKLLAVSGFCRQKEKANPEIARFRHPQLNKSINLPYLVVTRLFL